MAQPGEHIASNRYFRAIDGLRLLASVNIALFHLAAIGGLYNMHGNPAWFFRIINGPAFHASAFFLLGGFIFSIKFAPTIGHFTTRAFITKRFKELYPLHAVTTLVMVILFIGRRYGTEVFSLPKLLFSTGIHLSMLWSVFPFHSYALNRPSWALSAFFLCYLLFGFFLKYVLQIKRKTLVLILAIVCMLPLFLWSLLYRNLGMPEHLYHFFHSFAPIRFFEFLIGMFLARFYQLSGSFIENRKIPIFNDLLILFSLTAIYANLHISAKDSPFLHWLSYHIFMTPLYAVLLFSLAVERGIIVRLLSLHWIRQIGKSSFYPYLLHIPLISLTTFILERFFNYRKFLHSPLNILGFTLVLYSGCFFYANYARAKRKRKVVKMSAPSDKPDKKDEKEEKNTLFPTAQ